MPETSTTSSTSTSTTEATTTTQVVTTTTEPCDWPECLPFTGPEVEGGAGYDWSPHIMWGVALVAVGLVTVFYVAREDE